MFKSINRITNLKTINVGKKVEKIIYTIVLNRYTFGNVTIMSLTSFLKDTENQDVRNELKTKFLRPQFNLKIDIKAPPLTRNGGIVGTAFDYLFRSNLKYIHPKHKFDETGWVADRAFIVLKTKFGKKKLYCEPLKILKRKYKEAKVNFELYHKTGEATDAVIDSSIFLAKLDLYTRSGYLDTNYDNCSQLDIQDIRAMLSVINPETFKINKRCWLNPVFGGSAFVGGADADADVIIDDTLIDIKTTKHLKLNRSDLNQIICYYILSLMGGVNCKENDIPIKNIGIYFARYGELWTVPLSGLGETQTFHDFKNWLFAYSREDGLSYDIVIAIISKLYTKKKRKKTTIL